MVGCIAYLEHLRAMAVVKAVLVVWGVLVTVVLLMRWKGREIVGYFGGALERGGGSGGVVGEGGVGEELQAG